MRLRPAKIRLGYLFRTAVRTAVEDSTFTGKLKAGEDRVGKLKLSLVQSILWMYRQAHESEISYVLGDQDRKCQVSLSHLWTQCVPLTCLQPHEHQTCRRLFQLLAGSGCAAAPAPPSPTPSAASLFAAMPQPAVKTHTLPRRDRVIDSTFGCTHCHPNFVVLGMSLWC